jgi:hypothetical protein
MDSALQTIKMRRKKTVKKPSLEELEAQMMDMSMDTDTDRDMDIMTKMSSTTWQRPASWREPRTKGEEVDQLVMEWYSRLGQPVPPGELIGKEMDEMDNKMWSVFLDTHTEPVDGMWGGEPTKSPEDELGPRPEYGSKEFFGWWRKKTAMENAARAAQGLPPLPTKKEIEAEKAKKAAAKAAEKAAAKAAEKAAAAAAKEAEKAAKAAAKEAKAAAAAAKKKK